MSCTLTVQDAWSFVAALIKQQNLNVNNFEPGLSMARIIISRILAPPFVWRFNRSNFNFVVTNAGGLDYVESVPQLSRIETQWLIRNSDSQKFELEGSVSLAQNSGSRRPTQVAPQYDDNAGNITFRFDSLPDEAYTAYFDYQRKAPLLMAPSSLWAPFPDDLCHIPLQGMLTWAGMLVNDARFPIWEQDFIGSLLGAQDGLSEQDKAIFVNDWMALTRTVTRAQGMTQGGIAGRAK